MKCYSLIIGAGPEADANLRRITREHFSKGFTILEAKGGWFDPARGKFIREESRQILVCTKRPRRLRAWCKALARALDEEELLVVTVGHAKWYRFRAPAPAAAKAPAPPRKRGR